MTTRDVEKLSLQLSQSKRNPEYYISHAWLTDVENGTFTPSIYKLYTLSTIYRSRFSEMLGYFGLNMGDRDAGEPGGRMPHADLFSNRFSEFHQESLLPIPSPAAGLEQTKTLSQLSVALKSLPLSVLQYLNAKDGLLGFVGLRDFTLFPLIRPGSFVEISGRQNKIRPIPWTNEYDRPIYFVELRDRYVCSWCELADHILSIVPHPVSQQQIQRFKYPDEAEIVGRVTAVSMSLVEAEGERAPERVKANSLP